MSSAFIVGCGRIAGGFNRADRVRVLTHALAYQRAGVELAGCMDASAGAAQAFAADWNIVRHGTDLPALLNAARPEMVSICTPPVGRVETVKAVLAEPSVKRLLIEKPLAATAAEAREIATLLASSPVGVTVNYFRAFDPFYLDVERRTRSGDWGKLRIGTALYYGPAHTNPPHFIERLLAMFGPPRRAARLHGNPVNPVFVVEFADGPVHFVPAPECQYSVFELDLLFEHHRLRIVDSEVRAELFRSAPDPDFPGYKSLQRQPYLTAPSRDAFARAIDAARQAAPGPSALLARAVAVAEIIDTISQ